MRPIKLTMKAFISYKDEQVVDFSKFTDGLFLIEGDIGAGKTTIFDAISFALYGKASGDGRSRDDLHCNLVPKSEDTKVELVFSQSGKEYKVERRIHYGSVRGKAGEYRDPKEKVSLYMPNGDVIKKEVNNEIESVIGLNKDQFEKIGMLAQGEFRKFLEADSKGKEAILKKIIDVSEYERYQNILTKSEDKLKQDRKDNDNIVKNHMESVFLVPDPEEGLNEEMFLYGNPDLLKNLSMLKEKDEYTLKAVKEELGDIDGRINDLIAAKSKAESDNQNITYLENQRVRIAELNAKSTDMEALREKLEKVSVVVNKILHVIRTLDDLTQKEEENNKEIKGLEQENETLKEKMEVVSGLVDSDKEEQEKVDNLKKEAAGKKALLNIYDEVQELVNDIASKREDVDNKKEALEETLSSIGALMKKKESIASQSEAIQDSTEEKNKAQNYLDDIEEKQKRLKALAEDCHGIRESEKGLESASRDLERLLKEFENREKEYDIKFRQFIDSQAALIAEDLGKKLQDVGRATCPVCGTELRYGRDNCLAKPKDSHVNQEDLNKYKAALDAAETAWKEKSDSYSTTKTTVQTKKEAAVKSGRALFSECNNWEDLNEDYLNTKKEQLERERKSFMDVLEQKRQEEERAKELEEENSNVDEQIKDKTIEKTELEGAIKHGEEDIKSKQTKVDERRKTLEFESREEAEDQIALMEKDAAEKQKSIDEHKTELENLNNDYTRIETSLREKNERGGNIEKEIGKTKAELEGALSKNGFKTREEAMSIIENIELPEEWISVSSGLINDYDNEVKNIKASISDLEIKTEGLTIVDLDKMKESIGTAEDERKECRERLTEIASKRDNHVKAYEVVKEYEEKNAGTEHAWTILNRLSGMAKGVNTENGNMSFERFVMGAFFADLLEKANNKMITLTGGRYQLGHLTTADRIDRAAGLDVEIINMAEGVTISKGSLSGGEKFLASLSLALGLSDMAQARFGGRTLDSLFIDEGFGTLDEKSLNLTMNVLTGLTNKGNRLVGLISHVDVSEYPIPHKLHVVKHNSASRIE